jgi:ABC-2 type transport system permease protein
VEVFIWLLTTNMPLIMLLLWGSVAREGKIGSYGSKEFAQYFLAVLITRLLTGSWVAWQMHEELETTRINLRLLHPIHPFRAYMAEHLGHYPVRLLFLIPVVAVFLYIHPHPQKTPLFTYFLFPFAVSMSWLIQFMALSMIGSLCLIWERSLSLHDIWFAGFMVLSGYIFPLDLLPPHLKVLFHFLPFPYIIHFPSGILLGRFSPAELLILFSAQIGMVVLFTTSSLLLFRYARKQFMAMGG